MRTALQLWLVAHRVPLHVAGGTVAVAPLMLTLALAFLVARAAAVLARGQGIAGGRGVLTVSLAVGLPYAGLTTFVAAAARSDEVSPAPLPALAAGLLLGCLAAAWGAARGGGLVRALATVASRRGARPMLAGGAAVGGLLLGATLLVTAGLMLHAGEVGHGIAALGGGAVAAVAVAAARPRAAAERGHLRPRVPRRTGLRGRCRHLGDPRRLDRGDAPRTASGGGRTRRSRATARDGAGGPDARGRRRGRRLGRRPGGRAAAAVDRSSGRAGAVAGVVAAVLAALGGGPAAPGAMAVFGASPWQVGLAVAAEVAVVAAGTVGALTWRRGR